MKAGKQVLVGLAAVFFTLGALLFGVPGIRFSALFFLGLGALVLIWLALGQLSEKRRFFKICKRIFLVGICAAAVLLGCVEAMILSCGEEDHSALAVDAVIVLGAGVNGERPSVVLGSRIQKAAEYMALHPDIPVVLSGGQGDGENISEAECMYRALRSGGAEDGRLLLEDCSTSTAENFAFSKALLQEWGLDTETARIAVVTNGFHLFRSRFIAQREGLSVVGIPAELPWWWLTANYYLRESFAMVKTVLFD